MNQQAHLDDNQTHVRDYSEELMFAWDYGLLHVEYVISRESSMLLTRMRSRDYNLGLV